MCGEKNYVAVIWRGVVGSPPRVRGEVQTMFPSWAGDRITPACAGRSRRSPGLSSRGEDHPRVCGEKFRTFAIPPTIWDHPRVCGEKELSVASLPDDRGSPPRVRGEAYHHGAYVQVLWITPACAGRRVSSVLLPRTVEDHPRVCGEKTKKIPNISRFYPGAACFSFSFS